MMSEVETFRIVCDLYSSTGVTGHLEMSLEAPYPYDFTTIHQCRGLTLLWLSSRHKIANSRFSLGSRLTEGCWSIVTMLARILTKYWSMNHAQCQLGSWDQRLLKTRDYANLGSGEWEYPLERESDGLNLLTLCIVISSIRISGLEDETSLFLLRHFRLIMRCS